MPELPEVETVCLALAPVLEGAVLQNVIVRQPQLRFLVPPEFSDVLVGQKVLTVRRRAKYILIKTERGDVVIGHLGMSGRMTIYKSAHEAPEPGRHDHIDFETAAGPIVRFADPRKFGLMLLTDQESLEDHKLIRHLGPDPLGNGFNETVLALALKGRKTAIKAALLDQKTLAGLGNIYVCEALFRAGLSPRRKAATVQGVRAARLTQAIRAVLLEAIAAGGSTLRDHKQPDGELGYFQHSFKVYGRESEPCPGCDCDVAKTGGIGRLVQSGRSTYFCARKQR